MFDYFETNLLIVHMSPSGLEISRVMQTETPFGEGTIESIRDKTQSKINMNSIMSNPTMYPRPLFIQVGEYVIYKNTQYAFSKIGYDALGGYNFYIWEAKKMDMLRLSLAEMQTEVTFID